MLSKTTTEPGWRLRPRMRLAPSTGERSGVWSSLTGVGTATMWKRASRSLASSAVNSTAVARIASSPTSCVGSTPDWYSAIFAALRSKPTTLTFRAKATAIGMPT